MNIWILVRTLGVLLVTAVAAAAAAPAGASDFDVANGGTFPSLDAGSSRFVIDGPIGPVHWTCASSEVSTAVVAGTYASGDPVGSARLSFGDCTILAGVELEVTCQDADLAIDTVAPTGALGRIEGVDCDWYVPLLDCAVDLVGDTDVEYVNPTDAPQDDGVVRVVATGQSLQFANSECPLFIPNGDAEYGAPGAGVTDVLDLDHELDPADAPHPVITGRDFGIAPGGAFPSLDAGASRLVVGSGAAVWNCSSSSFNATIVAGTYAFGDTVGQVKPTFSNCTTFADMPFEVTCEYADLAVDGLTPTGAEGRIENIDCTWYFPLLDCSADLVGGVQGEYFNPAGGSNGLLNVEAAGQTLSVVNSECPTFIPNGSAQYGSPVPSSPAAVGDLAYELDPADAPHPVIS